MEQFVIALLVTAVGAPAFAWAASQSGSRKAFERDRAKFEAGRGRDPSRRILGPHLSFGRNVLGAAAIVFPIAFVILLMTR